MTRLGILISLIISPALVLADGFDYTFVDAAIVETDLDVGPVDIDGDGIGVSGSFAINDQLHFVGGYVDQDYGAGFDTSTLNLGVGFHTGLSEDLDFVADLSYVDAEVSTGLGTADETGYAIGAGIRTRAGDSVEIDAGIRHINLDDSDTGFVLGARYYFSDSFAVRAGLTDIDDGTGWSIGVRWDFGRDSSRGNALR